MMTIFLVFILLGQTISAIGVAVSEFWFMIIGRALYGFGGDSLLVTELAFLAEYFHGDGMGLALVSILKTFIDDSKGSYTNVDRNE